MAIFVIVETVRSERGWHEPDMDFVRGVVESASKEGAAAKLNLQLDEDGCILRPIYLGRDSYLSFQEARVFNDGLELRRAIGPSKKRRRRRHG